MKKIKICIADDHAVIRRGTREILTSGVLPERHLEICEARDGIEVLDCMSSFHPDLVLMDIMMPRLDGIQATRLIAERKDGAKVIIMSVHQDQRYVIEAFRAGAMGYVVKTAEPDDLVAAIRSVRDGKWYASPRISDAMLDHYFEIIRKKRKLDPFDSLSTREKTVLKMVADGATNREIAQRLFIAESTVKSHRLKIMEKLRVSDKAGLIKIAVQKGMAKMD